MRAFLLACLAIIAIGAAGYFFLDSQQKSSGIAFSSEAARIDPQWAWRSVFRKSGTDAPAAKTAANVAPREEVYACETRSTWQWIFVDLGTPEGEPGVCSDSQ